MTTIRLQRSFAVLVVTAASLIATATPASAATHDAEITGGVITFTKTGVTEAITLTGTDSCTTPSLTIDLGGETSGSGVAVTSFNSSHVQTYTNASLLTVLTRSTSGGTSGTLGSSTFTHTVTSMRVPVDIKIYGTTECTPGTLLCKLAGLIHLTGNGTSTTTSSTYSFTGTSVGLVVANPTCNAGASQILGTASNLTTAMTAHLTT